MYICSTVFGIYSDLNIIFLKKKHIFPNLKFIIKLFFCIGNTICKFYTLEHGANENVNGIYSYQLFKIV